MAVVLCLGAASGAADAASSPWRKEDGAALRLISAGRAADGSYRAGLEIALDPGVKTYWRTPGEAGVPPLFDWSRSVNLARADIAWPAPRTFDDAGSTGFGYVMRVVFPVSVRPAEAGSPVVLDLDLDFAVCRDLCVPLRANLSLILQPAAPPDPASAALLDRAGRSVPRQVAAGEPGSLRFDAVRIEKTTPPQLSVRVDGPPGAPPELFVETPDGWPLARPVRSGSADGLTTFTVPLRKFTGEAGHAVVLTAVSAGQGIELTVDPAVLEGE